MLLMLLGAGNRAWGGVRCNYAYDAAAHRNQKAVIGDRGHHPRTHGCYLANQFPLGENADCPATSPKWAALTYDAEGLHAMKRGIRALSEGPTRPPATVVVMAYQWDAQNHLFIVWIQVGMNLYAYCNGDPVNNWDYLGMVTGEELAAINRQRIQEGLPPLQMMNFMGGLGVPTMVCHGRNGMGRIPGVSSNYSWLGGDDYNSGTEGHKAGNLAAGGGGAIARAPKDIANFLVTFSRVLRGWDRDESMEPYFDAESTETWAREGIYPEVDHNSLITGSGKLGGDVLVMLAPIKVPRFMGAMTSSAAALLDRITWRLEFNRSPAVLYGGWPLYKPFRVVPNAVVTAGSVTPEIFKASLRRFNTPTTTVTGQWEIANTGRYNYTVSGGGTTLDVDGIIGRTIQEAKFIMKPGSSPFIPGSKIPDFLRTKIVGQVDDEFARMRRIIADPGNPLRDVEVIINNPAAESFFLNMLKKHNLDGRVIIR